MKIEFKKLSARNTWSYKELDLTLSGKGLCTIIGKNKDAGGSNGAGKSAIQRLFFYGITGLTPEGLKTEDLLSDFHPKNSEVHVQFYMGPDEYLISRYRNHSTYDDKLYLFKNGNDISSKRKDDTQKLIYERLKLDRDSLLLLTLFSTDTVNFAKVLPSERRKTFLSLFPQIERYKDQYSTVFKTKRNLIITDILSVEKDIVSAESRVESTTTFIRRMIEEKKEIERRLEELRDNYKNSDVKKNESELITMINEHTKYIRETYSKPIVDNLDKIPALLKKITDEYNGTIQESSLITATELKGYTKDLELVQYSRKMLDKAKETIQKELSAGSCSHCGAQFSKDNMPDKMKNEVLSLSKEEEEIDKKQKAIESSIEKVQKAIKELNNKKEILEKKKNLLNKVHVDLDKITYWKTQQLQLMPGLLEMEKSIGSAEESIKSKIASIQEYRIKLVEEKSNLEQLNKKLKICELQKTQLDYLYKISSVDIPTFLLNKYLAILEEESSKILGTLFNGMSIKITDTNKDKPELSIGIDNMIGVVKDYKTFSGGEKQAIDISLLFGIQRLVMRETGTVPNLIFLDEILDISADDVRTQNIMKFVKEESKAYDSVFLISHKSTLTEESDSSMVITKENGISTLNFVE